MYSLCTYSSMKKSGLLMKMYIPILLALTSYKKYFHKETNYPCLNILFIFAKGPLAKHV